MSTKTIIQTLFAYTWHTNSRLLEQAAQLADADFQEKPGFGRGSMHEIFFHLLKTSNNWRQGIETGKRSYALNAEDYPTLASIQAGFQKEQAAWQAFLEALSAEDVEGDVTITRRSGEVEYVPPGASCITWRCTACSTTPSWR